MKKPTSEEIIIQDIESMKSCPGDMDCENCLESLCVKLVAEADLPSIHGHFRILAFINNKDGKDHTVILKGNIGDGENVLTRIHSACLTGESLGSLRCDCADQLQQAMQAIEKEGRGIVLYHQEEGRGIGLANKIRAYALQDAGLDTYDANIMLGFAADERDYLIPAAMLKKMGVKSVRLMTNNPEKVKDLERYGITVTERVQHELPPNSHNHDYLAAKKERFGHLLKME